MKNTRLYLYFLLLLTACTPKNKENISNASSPAAIAPYAEDPRFWSYAGTPVLLLGGSREDNLFQIEGLAGHLDTLAAAGGNYIRNTMSSRDAGNLWPFFRLPDGRYDLDRFNEEYFNRLDTLLRLTAERDIIVQVEIWDRFDYARDPWLENPFRPSNNINYDSTESRMSNFYPRHPGRNDNPFFRTVPSLDNNALILTFQQSLVRRILQSTLAYDHVLYCMDNETSAHPDWGAYWARFIKAEAQKQDKAVYCTEMWDAWDLQNEQHQNTLDHPELYDFADISQNNHNKGQEHWDNLHWVRAYTAASPRPLNHVKIYGADTGRYGTDRDGIERFWRSLLGGAASIRFHRPASGLGLRPEVQSCLRSARMLAGRFDFCRAQPDVESRLLTDRAPNEAYLSFIADETYALYFPDGGAVQLDLRPIEGSMKIHWLHVLESRWLELEMIKAGDWITLEAPGEGHWVALVSQ